MIYLTKSKLSFTKFKTKNTSILSERIKSLQLLGFILLLIIFYVFNFLASSNQSLVLLSKISILVEHFNLICLLSLFLLRNNHGFYFFRFWQGKHNNWLQYKIETNQFTLMQLKRLICMLVLKKLSFHEQCLVAPSLYRELLISIKPRLS